MINRFVVDILVIFFFLFFKVLVKLKVVEEEKNFLENRLEIEM